MKTKIPVFCLMASVLLIEACAKDKVIIEDHVSYADYSPGFTGYSQGTFNGYGDYNNGFGPSFWNPHPKRYTDYNPGYGIKRDMEQF